MHNFHLFSSGCAHKCIVRKLPSCYSSLQLQISLMVDVKCSVVDRRAQEYVLLFNGVIYCEQDVIKNWMVVDQENGTIAAIGSDSELSTAEKLWRPERKIDLHGQFVLPGLHDAHIHVHNLGRLLTTLNLKETKSIDEIQQRIRDYVRKEEKNSRKIDIIFGSGWDHETLAEKRYLRKEDIDQVVFDKEVVLFRTCGHIAVVNSKTLEKLGITKDTPDPEGGAIDRDPNGEPTGILREMAADLVTKHVLGNKETRKQYICEGLQYCLKKGITTVQTNDENAWEIYEELAKENKLPIRVFLTIYHNELNSPKSPKPRQTCGPLLTAQRVKIISDGALGSETAALRKPYLGTRDKRGLLIYNRELLKKMVLEAHQKGWQLEVHAIGDEAAEAVLDAFEHCRMTAKDRPILTHCQVLGADLIQRMSKLQVIANIQPQFVTTDSTWIEKRVQPEVLPYCYSWKTILKSGIPVAGGSDAPVEDANPLAGLYAAIFRNTAYRKSTNKGVVSWRPEECLTFDEAVHIYTVGSAYAVSSEHVLGKLRPGWRADFVILDKNVHQDAKLLAAATVQQVWVNGYCHYNVESNSVQKECSAFKYNSSDC